MKLSFIVPVYNVEDYLTDCLQSLYTQSLAESDFEVVIVNDGSLDSSSVIVEDFQKKHANIKYYTQTNQGLSAARNMGIEKAQGEYILCIDSDDFLLPDTIVLLLEKAIENDLEVMRGEYRHCDDAGNLLPPMPINKISKSYANQIVDGDILYRCIFGIAFFSPLLMIKRTLLLTHNLYFTKGLYFEDIDFALRLSFLVKRVMYLPVIFYVYRLRNGSITASMSEKKLNDLVSIILKLRSYSQSVHCQPETRKVMERNLTNLCVYFLLRVTEFAFSNRHQIMKPFVTNHIRPLRVAGGTKEKIVSFLYNLLGSGVIYLLYPALKIKSFIHNRI